VALQPDDAQALDHAAAEMLTELLRRTHLSAPSDVGRTIAECAGAIGARDVALYLVDYELKTLMPVPGATPPGEGAPLSVAGTVAGRAYSSTSIRESPQRDGRDRRLWLPLLDGTERLGVMGLSFDAQEIDEGTIAIAERYAHLAAVLIVAKSAYGDTFEVVRRRRDMTIASELLWGLTPPLVFATDHLLLAGMLEPCYDNGGDALDYAVDDDVLHVAVFDAMGHGLTAAGVAAFAVAAYRHSRRRGCDLLETYEAMDAAVTHQFPDDRFVTALIARLDLAHGELAWVSAGHPPPLVIRDGRRTRVLARAPAPPLGVALAGSPPRVSRETLEPGDLLLLYTDGLSEARGPDGRRFTAEGLSAFVEREAASGQIAPETLRRLRQAIVDRREGRLDDDATAVLLEWRRGGERRIVPQTVLEP
jgi:serine/threonine protein phosphatase PrpC